MMEVVEYDEQAVAWIEALEARLARRLPDDRFGAFAAILNAIEYQVEEGQADPTVLRHLGEALLALAAVHRLPVVAIKDVTQTLGLLHSHAAARHQASRTTLRSYSHPTTLSHAPSRGREHRFAPRDSEVLGGSVNAYRRGSTQLALDEAIAVLARFLRVPLGRMIISFVLA